MRVDHRRRQKQAVVIKSNKIPVSSGVPQVSLLGPPRNRHSKPRTVAKDVGYAI